MTSYENSDQGQFYQSVVETIGLALQLPGCIWLLDSERQALKIVAAQGLSDSYVRNAFLSLDEASVAAEVLRTGKTAVIENIAQDQRWKYRAEAKTMQLRSAMVVPLRVKGKTVGVLDVYSDVVRSFTDFERTLVENLAAQVAATEQLVADMTEINRISHLINTELRPLSGQNLAEVLVGVANSARSVLGADLVDVYEYHAAENRYVLPPTTTGELQGEKVIKTEVYEDDTLVQVVQSHQAKYYAEAQAETLLTRPFTVERPEQPQQRFVVREKILSSAAIPLETAGEVVGVMFINFRTKQEFRLEQRNAIELYATQAAFAISSARTFARLERRIEVLKALNDVGTRLSLAKDLSEILLVIVESACTVMGAEVATIHLFDPKKQEFRDLDQAAVYPPEARAQMDKPRGNGLGMQVIHAPEGKVVAAKVDDTTVTCSTFVREQGIQAFVGLRLSSTDEPLGVLYLSFKRGRQFSDEDLALYDVLASYASTAIFQSTLFTQRDAVTAIARNITSTLDRKELLQRTLEQSLELLNCESGSISVYDPKENTLQFEYAVGKSEKQGVRMGQGLIGTAAATRKPILVNDVSADERYVEHVAATRSELDVPMLAGERLIGVLNAESNRLNAFSEEDKRLAQALAAQAAVAFQTAELYAESQMHLQERINDIETLQRVFSSIGTGSLETVLTQIAEEAARLTPAKYTGIWLVGKRRQELTFGAANEGTHKPAQGLPDLPMDETCINGHVALAGKTYLQNDVSEDLHYRPWYPDVKSELAVPLKYGGRIIGTLNLESPALNGFTEDHRRLAESLAGAAAAAIHSARILQSLHIVNEVGQALTQNVRLDEEALLRLIHQKASEIMDTDNMYIALYDAPIDEVRFGLAYVSGHKVDVSASEGWLPRRAGKGRTEAVIQSRKGILTKTKKESELWYKEPGHTEYIGQSFASWLGVPLTLETEVLGVIATYNAEKDYVYSEDDQEILEILAGQVATAIANRRLFTRIERLKNALLELGEGLTSAVALPEDKIVDLVFSETLKLTGSRDGYVALYNEQTNEIAFRVAMEKGDRVRTGVGGWASRQISKTQMGRTEEMIVTGEPIWHSTYQESQDWYNRPDHAEFLGKTACSYLGVPILLGKRVLGVIAIYDWEREHAYDEDHQAVLLAMGGQAAIALQNARLYRQARSEVIASRQLATLGIAMAALQHRISNTFNLISPNLERLRKRVDVEDTTVVEILDIIDRNVHYTSDIIRRILEPLRNHELQSVNTNALLEEVLEDVCRLRQGDSSLPKISVVHNLDPAVPVIRAPSGQLAEVFRNLVENAFSAMRMGGELQIHTQLTDSQIQVRLSDTGPGIPTHIRQRLFNEPVPSSTPGEGAGLGLWLSNLILLSLGGEIKIEETTPAGTTMKVSIPVSGMQEGA